MGELWDRQPGESDQAFHAFCHYRDLSKGNRSVDAARRTHITICRGLPPPATRRPGRSWFERSQRYRWLDRVAAYDAYLDRRAREEVEAIILKRRRDQAEQLAMTRTTLSIPAAVVAKRMQDPEFLKSLSVQDPSGLIALVARVAQALPGIVNAERLIMGETTQRIALDSQVTDDGAFNAKLQSDPESVRIVSQLAARLVNDSAGRAAILGVPGESRGVEGAETPPIPERKTG